ncbi:MAG: aminodeoxychorismate/anthranilate synthase component II [Bacteroidales bacterium]|nr:aminodeoxychorismate/anthranilate synthase component II [Bacteroidales bacterium]
MKILLLDNYDSFTYNLAQLLEESGMCTFDIVKNDEVELLDVEKYDKILLSPGPDIPSKAGKMADLIAQYFDKKPILGVCLGMQAIAEFFGGQIYNLQKVYHGVNQQIIVDSGEVLFHKLDEVQNVGLYHSWAVSKENFPSELRITATSTDGIIMAISHKNYNVRGVQFHPESYITKNGKQMIENWIKNN